MIEHREIILKKHLIKMNTLRIERQDKQDKHMTKIFESPDGGKTVYERDFGVYDKKTLIAGKSKTIDAFYENTIREAADVARSFMLTTTRAAPSGKQLDDSYGTAEAVEQAILKHFGLE